MEDLKYTGHENWTILNDRHGDTWNDGYLCKCLSCNQEFVAIFPKNYGIVNHPIKKFDVYVPKCPNGCNQIRNFDG